MKRFTLAIAVLLFSVASANADFKGTVPASGSTFGAAIDSNSRNMASVSGAIYTNAQTPTVTASTYGASVDIGGILTFSNVLPSSPGPFSGTLQSITVKFKGSAQTVGFWVAVFSASPAGTFTDHTTAAIATADSAILLGMYHLNAPTSALGTHTIYNMDAIGKAIVGSSANLFVVVVPDATTAALASTSDMIVELGVQW